MITVRPAEARGRTSISWLDSRHTFSFNDYYDPQHMGFHALRVINDDRVLPGSGFGAHAHRDMEILTYVLSGGLAHKDSLGTGSVIRPGDLQRMSAGTGIRHSEWNASETEAVHFLQIWIVPAKAGLPPAYEQISFAPEGRRNQPQLIAAPDGQEGSLTVRQDVKVHAVGLTEGGHTHLDLAPGRSGWVQIARGAASLNGTPLAEGDGAAVAGERRLELAAGDGAGAEVLVFDLA